VVRRPGTSTKDAAFGAVGPKRPAGAGSQAGGMTEALLDVVHDVMASPWIYLAILALAWLDGFLPAFPSETAVITAGVFAADGRPVWALVAVAAAVGAFAGDCTSYALGYRLRHGVARRAGTGTRRAAALARARRALDTRGGLIVVVARYVPGGRTAVTLTAGAVGYPLRRFAGFAALAAASWGLYGTLVGLIGGAAFEDQPLKGVALGLGLALSVTAVVEVLRFVLRRRARATASAPPVPERVPVGAAHREGP
jgi:membrane protein DedA with SNARE-associated domain